MATRRLQFYDAYPLPDADNVTDYLLKPLGNNYTRLGDYNTARYTFMIKRCSLPGKRGHQQEVAAAYSNMATCARWKGDLAAASQYAQAGLQAVSQQSALYGLLLSTHAEVLAEEGRYDTAALVSTQALQWLAKHRREPEAAYWYGSALQLAAQIALKQQQVKNAVRYALDAQRWLQQQYPNTRQREKAKTAVLLGAVYLQAGDLKPALLAYQAALQGLLPQWNPPNPDAVPDVRLLYSESLLTDALAGKAAVLERMQQPQTALAHYLIVFNAVHRLQGVFYTNAAKLKEQELSKARAGAAMQLAYRLWKKTGAPGYKEQLLLIAEWSKAQLLVQERSLRAPTHAINDSVARRIQQLEEAIAYYQREQATVPGNSAIAGNLQSTEYELSLLRKGSQQPAGPSGDHTVLTAESLHQYLQALPAGVTLLEFFAGRDTSFIIEANNQSIKDIRVIAHSAPLQDTIAQFVRRWYLQGGGAMLNAPRKYFEEKCCAVPGAVWRLCLASG